MRGDRQAEEAAIRVQRKSSGTKVATNKSGSSLNILRRSSKEKSYVVSLGCQRGSLYRAEDSCVCVLSLDLRCMLFLTIVAVVVVVVDDVAVDVAAVFMRELLYGASYS